MPTALANTFLLLAQLTSRKVQGQLARACPTAEACRLATLPLALLLLGLVLGLTQPVVSIRMRVGDKQETSDSEFQPSPAPSRGTFAAEEDAMLQLLINNRAASLADMPAKSEHGSEATSAAAGRRRALESDSELVPSHLPSAVKRVRRRNRHRLRLLP